MGREDENCEVGLQALLNFANDVLARCDFALVQPDFDLVFRVPFQKRREVAHEWLVLAGVAEEDRDR